MRRIESELSPTFHDPHDVLQAWIVTRPQPFKTMLKNTGQLIGNGNPDCDKDEDKNQRPKFIVFK